MTESTKRPMTAGTSTQTTRAAAMMRARRIAEGRDPDAPTRGPMAEMMRQAGFTADQIAATRDNFTGGPMEVEIQMCIGEAGRQELRGQFDRVIAEMRGE